MASTTQQKPANETSSQEQHKFWGGKVFGGHKLSTDQQGAQQQQQQNSGWWFGGHKQAPTASAHTHQHCSTCQCSTPEKSMKPAACEGMPKKEHAIGVTLRKEEHITAIKHDKGATPRHAAKTEMKMEEKMSGKKVEMKEQHVGNVVRGRSNVCSDAKSKGSVTKEEAACGNNNKAGVIGGVGKKKEQKESHCFRSMAGHVKQRIAMMRNNHDGKFSDSSSSDSEDEKTDKKKKEKGHSHGPKTTAK